MEPRHTPLQRRVRSARGQGTRGQGMKIPLKCWFYLIFVLELDSNPVPAQRVW